MRRNEEEGTRASSGVTSEWNRGNGYKLKHTKFHLDKRKHFFTCENSKTLGQVAQRGYKNLHSWTAHAPLSNPAWVEQLY